MHIFIRDKDNQDKMIIRIIFSLFPLLFYLMYKNSTDNNFLNILSPIINIFLSSILSFIIEYIYKIVTKKNNVNITNCILQGFLLTFLLPFNVSKYIILIGTFLISISKLTLNNIKFINLNPLLFGYLIIYLIFKESVINGMIFTNSNIYVVTILLLFSYIYLGITNTIKWRIPLAYLIIVFIMNYVISQLLKQNLETSFMNILNSGIIFSAIYLSIDYKTSTSTPIGQILEGILLGMLTLGFKYIGFEYIASSILITNLFRNQIDKIGALSRFNIIKALKLFVIIGFIIIIEIVGIAIYNRNINPINVNYQKSLN